MWEYVFVGGLIVVVTALRCFGRQSTPSKLRPIDLTRIKKFAKYHDSGRCNPTLIKPSEYTQILSTLEQLETRVGGCCVGNVKKLISTVQNHSGAEICTEQPIARLLDTLCIRELFGESAHATTLTEFLSFHSEGDCVAATADMPVDSTLTTLLGPATVSDLQAMIKDHQGVRGCEYPNQYASLSESVLGQGNDPDDSPLPFVHSYMKTNLFAPDTCRAERLDKPTTVTLANTYLVCNT